MSNITKLPPYPNGWYNLGLSSELAEGQLVTKKFMGQEIVLFRTQKGEINAIEAYCPHLGGHFGHGGTVEGEEIRCPFHGFCFNGSGECTSTPYGTKPPPTAIARTWPVRDKNGFILAYHDNPEKQPDWEIPNVNYNGWTSLITTSFDVRSHPQETSENSVDLGHFTEVHKYTGIEVLKPLITEGPYLNTKYAMHRTANFLGKHQTIRAEFEVHVHGLGYSTVEVEVPHFGLEYRTYVLSTPIEDGKINLTLGLTMKHIKSAWKVNPAMVLLPKPWMNRLMRRLSFNGYVHDVKQDFDIWENKAYVAPPALAKGDGPVGKYRSWCKQFYPKLQQRVVAELAG